MGDANLELGLYKPIRRPRQMSLDETVLYDHAYLLAAGVTFFGIIATVRLCLYRRRPKDLQSPSYLVGYQGAVILFAIVIIVLTSELVSDLEAFASGANRVVAYPKLVSDDVRNNNLGNLCNAVKDDILQETEAYKFDNFGEIEIDFGLAYLFSATLLVLVVFYVVVDFVGLNFAAALGPMVWGVAILTFAAATATRGGLVAACKWVDIPEESRFIFYQNPELNHPFLDQFRLACVSAPQVVLRHFSPGFLANERQDLDDLCTHGPRVLVGILVMVFVMLIFTTGVAILLRSQPD